MKRELTAAAAGLQGLKPPHIEQENELPWDENGGWSANWDSTALGDILAHPASQVDNDPSTTSTAAT